MKWVWALIALSLPARFFLMQRSIWLDEAWVAKSRNFDQVRTGCAT
jgi:hypothetical protein